jgi:hypothetical protein
MKRDQKNSYNRDYYLRNKEKILEKARHRAGERKQPTSNVIPLFKAESSDIGHPVRPSDKSRRRCNSSTLILQILVAAITVFLIKETAHFYKSTDGDEIMAWFRAFLLEGIVFAFSLMKGRSGLIGFFYKSMAVLIYLCGLWVVSSSVVHTAFHERRQLELHQEALHELEAEISKKTAMRDAFFDTNRITLAVKVDKALEDLKQKLERSRELLIKSPNPLVIWNTLLSLLAFRVLLLISNLACLNELGRRYRFKTRAV